MSLGEQLELFPAPSVPEEDLMGPPPGSVALNPNLGPTGRRAPKPGEPGYVPDIMPGALDEDHTPFGYPRCTAWSRQQQRRCRQQSIPGAPTCKYHGSNNKVTLAHTRLQLIAASDVAMKRLIHEVSHAEKAADRIRAADSILDRAGFRRGVDVVATDLREVLVARLMEIRERREQEALEELQMEEGHEGTLELPSGQGEGTESPGDIVSGEVVPDV